MGAAKATRDLHEVVPIVGLSLAAAGPILVPIPEDRAEAVMIACLRSIILLPVAELTAVVLASEERGVVFLFPSSFLLVAWRCPSLDVYMLLMYERHFYDIVRMKLGASSVLCVDLLRVQSVLRELAVVVLHEKVCDFLYGTAPPFYRNFRDQL